jgi:hypothetical protein
MMGEGVDEKLKHLNLKVLLEYVVVLLQNHNDEAHVPFQQLYALKINLKLEQKTELGQKIGEKIKKYITSICFHQLVESHEEH